ncbi:Stk1 family PASTA domain-containing Ser/Thr kinase [bacterium c-19]|nr:Stk1 family PASTA domain-containing Ser/Thr kinase [bacterium c-19]
MISMNKMISDRYMIVTSLGEGGMADVYLAVDTILNREVAIKILRGELSSDPVTLLRFQREANAASKLDHPNVVDVYDVGESEGRHYIVMEYVRGRTLKQLISQRGALDKREAVDIMMQLTSAVQHAHENQIIHRDIKPQNVLVKDDGTVKITDFGIALAHDAVQLTQNDAVLGSAHYLAPETTRGEPASNQIDIYALGIVFYELLSGSVPFKGENPVQIAMKHLREDVPGIRDFNPTLPQTIENIIIKATVKNRKLRYQTAQEMLNDLKLCLMPEYANTAKLVFSETEAQPTVNVREPGNYPTESGKKKAEVVEEIVDTKKKGSKKGLWITLGILIATIITAIILYFSGVFNFFSYDPLIPVPSITDLTKEEALLKLTEAGFQESDIIFSEELSEATETGHVFDSDPKEGSEVRRRDGIQVMISKGNFYVLPDFKGKSLAEAEAELKKALPLAVISKETVATAENQPDEILEQSGPKIGDKLSPEKEVTIFFKVAKAPSLTIPNLIGEEIEAAKAKLESYGVYVVLYQRPTVGMSEEEIKALETGVVVEVDPPKGTEYKQDGSSNWITLYYY